MQAEKFSVAEQKHLVRKMAVQGAKKQCVLQTGISPSTLVRVLKTGRAGKDVARKLRTYLFIQVSASRVFIEIAA